MPLQPISLFFFFFLSTNSVSSPRLRTCPCPTLPPWPLGSPPSRRPYIRPCPRRPLRHLRALPCGFRRGGPGLRRPRARQASGLRLGLELGGRGLELGGATAGGASGAGGPGGPHGWPSARGWPAAPRPRPLHPQPARGPSASCAVEQGSSSSRLPAAAGPARAAELHSAPPRGWPSSQGGGEAARGRPAAGSAPPEVWRAAGRHRRRRQAEEDEAMGVYFR